MSRVQLQPAYVLHGRAFRESSQLLEMFSRDHGRVGVVARGARGARSRWRGVLQPFRPLLASWQGRGELATLTGADQVAAPPPLLGDALFSGLYVNELLVRLVHRGDPHPELFEHYRGTVAALAGGENIQATLRVFEKNLLDAAGFGLSLACEAGSDTPLRFEASYVYHPGEGAVRVNRDASDRGVVSGAALMALEAGEPQGEHLPGLRAMMRAVIRHHLGDRPLASDALYRPSKPTGRRTLEEESA
ncbi:DNA repair protein RecO [Marinihelvus fidelis]|nr:DNA repair protein RecO [Marinihelvus fidelis]